MTEVVTLPKNRWRLHDLPEVNARIQCELKVSDNLETYIRETLSLGKGHTADAWTAARMGRCAMVYLRGEGIRWVLWGRPDSEPSLVEVKRCETILRKLWSEGFCHPMFNGGHHHGFREYILTEGSSSHVAPYPSSPRMTDCWTDVEAIRERIRRAKGRATEEEGEDDERPRADEADHGDGLPRPVEGEGC